MRSILTLLATIILIAFTYVSSTVLAQSFNVPVGTSKVDVTQRIGKAVLGPKDTYLGTVKKLVTDTEGRVSFAIVSHKDMFGWGERDVAVPYSFLTYNTERQHFTCDVSWDRFVTAPAVENETELQDPSFRDDMYRYFGQHPYWTETSMGRSEE